MDAGGVGNAGCKICIQGSSEFSLTHVNWLNQWCKSKRSRWTIENEPEERANTKKVLN